MDDLSLLRLYIDDPRGEDEKFTDPDLQSIADGFVDDLYGAAAEVWRIKQANAAKYYSVQLDQGSLTLDQVFRHCGVMQKLYQDLSGAEIINIGMTTVVTDDSASEFSG